MEALKCAPTDIRKMMSFSDPDGKNSGTVIPLWNFQSPKAETPIDTGVSDPLPSRVPVRPRAHTPAHIQITKRLTTKQ